MYVLYCHLQHDNNTIIKTDAMIMTDARRKTSLQKYLPLTLLQGFEKGYSRFACKRELETKHNLKYFDPKFMAVSVVSFSFSRAAQPEAQGPLCWVMASFTASYQHLLWTPTHQGPKPLRPGVAFPTTLYSNWLQLNWLVELN